MIETCSHNMNMTLGEEQYKGLTEMAKDFKKKAPELVRILIENEYARKCVRAPLSRGILHKKEEKKTITFTLTPTQYKMLDELAERYEVTKMQLIRKLIEEEYLVWQFKAYDVVV